MLNLQHEFEEFHNIIKLDDENTNLRQKREILLNKLQKNITEDAASYTHFNQGSYAMGTGIKPDKGDYDIDVGLKFNINHDDYPDPVAVKKWVFDALNGHTKNVKIRRSCVTVTYQEGGEEAYHVDFAVYAANNLDSKLYIAKGKESSSLEKRIWEESNPQKLLKLIESLFDDSDDRKQFRRIIRYAKKWKNQNFDCSGNAAPTGIALTALAYHFFQPCFEKDELTETKTYNDFAAFKELMTKVLNSFSHRWDPSSQKFNYELHESLPVAPRNDLFEKMSSLQQNNFHDKVALLVDTLKEIEMCQKKSDACAALIKVFGEDFPMTVDRSFVGTSESA